MTSLPARLAVATLCLAAAQAVATGQCSRTAVNAGPGINHPAFGGDPEGAEPYLVPPFDPPADWIGPHCRQTYRLFVPEGAPPQEGWPVVIYLDLTGYIASNSVTELVAGERNHYPLLVLLQNGIAVIWATATHSQAAIPCGEFGLADMPIKGHGLFHPPGHVLSPPYDVAPYDRWDYPMAEKDALAVVQHVRRYAGADHLLRDIDGQRVAVMGGSAAAMSLMWSVFSEERKDQAPFDSDLGEQYAMSTIPDAAILHEGAVWWPIFDERVFNRHFGDIDTPLIPASSLGRVDPVVLEAASPLLYKDDGAGLTGVPVHMAYKRHSVCTDYDDNGGGCQDSFCFTDGGLEGESGTHPAWAGYAWKTLFPDTRLVITTCVAANQGGGLPDLVARSLTNGGENHQLVYDVAGWLKHRFGMGGWCTLTHMVLDDGCTQVSQGDGISTPSLSPVKGFPGGGGKALLRIENAEPNSSGTLFWGERPDDVSQYGGVVVPSNIEWDCSNQGPISALPDVGLFQTDEFGEAILLVPVGSADQRYYQATISDPDAPEGRTLTNVLVGTRPS